MACKSVPISPGHCSWKRSVTIEKYDLLSKDSSYLKQSGSSPEGVLRAA